MISEYFGADLKSPAALLTWVNTTTIQATLPFPTQAIGTGLHHGASWRKAVRSQQTGRGTLAQPTITADNPGNMGDTEIYIPARKKLQQAVRPNKYRIEQRTADCGKQQQLTINGTVHGSPFSAPDQEGMEMQCKRPIDIVGNLGIHGRYTYRIPALRFFRNTTVSYTITGNNFQPSSARPDMAHALTDLEEKSESLRPVLSAWPPWLNGVSGLFAANHGSMKE